MYRILSIDGGGIRGIIPLYILLKIEEITGKNTLDLFDFFVGTSTGGIIVATLNLKDPITGNSLYTVNDIMSMYINNGRDIFPETTFLSKFLNLFFSKYSNSGLKKILSKYITNQKISETIKPVLIPSYDLNSNLPVFFKTSEASINEHRDISLLDVCLATSAAPTYFPPFKIWWDKRKRTFIDGGVYANNPTMCAISEITKFSKKTYYTDSEILFKDIHVLSLGTGYVVPLKKSLLHAKGELSWLNNISDVMMNGNSKTVDYHANQMLEEGRYMRLNIDIVDRMYAGMDNVNPDVMRYLLDSVESQIFDDIGLTNKIRKFISKFIRE